MTSPNIKTILAALPGDGVSFNDTRGGPSVTFFESVSGGLATNGGLFMPETIPDALKKSPSFFSEVLPTLTIPEIAAVIHRLFIPRSDIPDDELLALMNEAYAFDIPIDRLENNIFIARLDQGPTASFKDFAARSIARLLEKYSVVHQKPLNIIVATSGDTGVAIADAFGNMKMITVTVLYPDGGVSEVQEKQMLAVAKQYTNVQSLPMKGNFDICQDIAKILQSLRNVGGQEVDEVRAHISYKLRQELSPEDIKELSTALQPLNLSSANSINIWRLIPQMLQYFASYAHLVKEGAIRGGDEVVIAVPTGNVGHIMAGIFARELGFPIKQFIMGTNANNIMANIIGSGVIRHRAFSPTSAPSMDILDPSNLERLFFFAAQKTKTVNPIRYEAMKKDIKNIGPDEDIDLAAYGVTPEMLDYLKNLIWAEDTETDDELYAMMAYQYQKNNVVLEPHGVAAVIASLRARSKGAFEETLPIIVFETAHPDKFPAALKASHLEEAPHSHHPVLERLQTQNMSDLGKPISQGIDLAQIVQKIKEIAGR